MLLLELVLEFWPRLQHCMITAGGRADNRIVAMEPGGDSVAVWHIMHNIIAKYDVKFLSIVNVRELWDHCFNVFLLLDVLNFKCSNLLIN